MAPRIVITLTVEDTSGHRHTSSPAKTKTTLRRCYTAEEIEDAIVELQGEFARTGLIPRLVRRLADKLKEVRGSRG